MSDSFINSTTLSGAATLADPAPGDAAVSAVLADAVRRFAPDGGERTAFTDSAAAIDAPVDQASELRAAVVRFERGGQFEPPPQFRVANHSPWTQSPRIGGAAADLAGRAAMAAPRAAPGRAAIIAVASGKGGVGKTQIAVNLAILLGRLGRRAVLIDADVGTANADLLIRAEPRYLLGDYLAGRCSARQLLCPVAPGVRFVGGCSGSAAAAEGLFGRVDRLLSWVTELDPSADVVVLDCGAGIGATVRAPAAAADLLLAVTTPEPTAVTDVYALIKSVLAAPVGSSSTAARQAPASRGGASATSRGIPVARPVSPYSMHFCSGRGGAMQSDRARGAWASDEATQRYATPELMLVVNQVARRSEAQRVAVRIFDVARRFLGLHLSEFAAMHDDRHVRAALMRRDPFVSAYPRCRATRDLMAVAQQVSQRAGLPRGN